MVDNIALLETVNNKRGSSAVFLTVILATLITITLGLIYIVKGETIRSSTDAIVNLAGDSVLSEYDRRIFEEYGLFLIKGTDKELTNKLNRYIGYSFNDMPSIKLESVKVSAEPFSVADPAIIKKQILEYGKQLELQGLLEIHKDDKGGIISDREGRSLNHGPTSVSLPSFQMPDTSIIAKAESLAEKTMNFEQVFKSGTDNFLINRYAMKHFNRKNKNNHDTHFFNNEIEYILCGKMTDEKNEKKIERALKAMRFPVNMAYLSADSKKQAALATAAQIMTPGPEAVATQAALTAAWAYAESDNDVELLWQGYKVPMVKDEFTWAIELGSVIEGLFTGCVKPDVEKGYTYDEYLQILLFFKSENIKLARIMDLIQINMRAEYDGDFLIGEYAGGIRVEVGANGNKYSYEKKY